MVRFLVVMGLAGALAATPVGAATFVVNSTADAVDATPGDGTCAAVGGACTLRAAVQEANALAGADTIQLPAGTFVLTLVGPGENSAATGDLDVTQQLEVIGASRDTTIIDGFGADRVFETQSNVAFAVRHLTIRNGNPVGAGGGIFHTGSSPLTLEDVAFVDDVGTIGGGVFVADGDVTVTGCVFRDLVSTGPGGGLGKGSSGNVTVSNTDFTNLRASGPGGGLYVGTTGALAVQRSTFTDMAGAPGGAVFGAVSGDITLTDLTVTRSVAPGSVGGGIYADAGGALTASNVTATEAFASGGPGGALYASAVTALTLTDFTATTTFAAGPGGAAYLSTSGGPVVVTGGTIQHALAVGPGGALLVTAAGTTQDATVRNVAITDASTSSGPGGGLYMSATRDVTVDGVTIDGASASGPGGGLSVSASQHATILGTRVTGCVSSAGPGGGIFASAGTTITVLTTTVDDDAADGGGPGGGAYLASTAVTITGSTASNNRATGASGLGGGLFAVGTTVTIANSTVSGNAAGFEAGGLFCSGTVTLTNDTFADNVAPTGGGIFNPGVTIHVANTIFAGGTTGGNCAGAALTSDGHNIDDGTTCGFALTGDQSSTDPQLGPLADNGGPTRTRMPAAGSHAIDHGDTCPATDQRGTTRPADGDGDGTAVCDVGAVEFVDQCPSDPAKTQPGICGCGVPDTDANANGVADCLLNAELKARIARAKTLVTSLDGTKTPAQAAIQAELKDLADGFIDYVKSHDAGIVKTAPKPKLMKLAKRARAMARAAAKRHGGGVGHAKAKATTALDAFDALVAPQ